MLSVEPLPHRVNGAPPGLAERGAPVRTYRRTCVECGTPYGAAQAHGEFCGPACRKAFNNRRQLRGAELYDLVMAWRCERTLAASMKVLRAICRLAADFRAADRRERPGRRSWRHPRRIADAKPYLFMTYFSAARTPRPEERD
jgi:hypothetical protein